MTVFLAELPWPDAKERLHSGRPVFLPLGATEQHGRHMALGVDAILPTAICERAARAVGGLVAPPLTYGVQSQPRTGGGHGFGGTINLSAHTFALVVGDVVSDLHRQGARNIVLVNGHYENVGASIAGIELALDRIGRDKLDGTTILRMDHWELVRPETIDRIFPDGYPGIELEHASVLETSYMLALRPELVDLSKALNDGPASFGPYDRFPRPNDGLPPSGVLSLTEGSTAEKGEWLLADCQARLLEIMAHEFGLTL